MLHSAKDTTIAIPRLRPLTARLALNTFWLILARLSNQVLAMVFTILLARYLGQSGLGQYAFITALVFLGNVITTFGLDSLLIREIGGRRSTDTPSLGAAVWIQIAISALFIIGIAFGAGFLSNKTPETILALKLYSFSLIPLAFYTVFSASLRAYERMDLFLCLNLATSGLQTGGALYILLAGGKLLTVVILLLAVQILAALIAYSLCVIYLPNFTIRWQVPGSTFSILLRLSWPLALLAGLAVIYQRMGILLLSMFAGDAATGWFTAASRVVEAFKIVPYAFLGALFPVMARLAFHGPVKPAGDGNSSTQVQISRTSLKFMLGFSLFAAIGVSWLSAPLVNLLFGKDYLPSIQVLKILAWSLIPYAYSAKVSLELVANGQEQVVVKVITLTVILSGILFFVLIHTLGLLGASLAALGGEIIQALAFLVLRR